MKKIFFSILITTISISIFGQSTFYKDSSLTLSSSPLDSVYRSGPVAISHIFPSAYQNKLLVTDVYNSTNDNRAAYFSLNEPIYGNPTPIGLASNTAESHNVFVANNYANFEDGKTFTDVHNSTAEFNYFRGINDSFGFNDGGDMAKAATLKLAGNFGNNGRDYKTTEFDILNMRFFTSTLAGNTATIDNFYALRMEDFRGVNTAMITNGWGVYIKPSILNNYFGGKVGIGTSTVSHALTVSAASDPVKIVGLQKANDKHFVTLDENGVLHQQDMQMGHANFVSNTGDVALTDDYFLYIHTGGDVVYTLPAASTRTGKTWKVVNVGSGSITLTIPIKEGDQDRNTILNKAGAYSYEIFSDGTQYIAIK